MAMAGGMVTERTAGAGARASGRGRQAGRHAERPVRAAGGRVRVERRFVANASHELRTPLSAGRALLQVAVADPDATVDSLKAACQEILDLGDHPEHLIAALLTLATSQRGLARAEPLDLADLTGKVLVAREDDAARRHLQVTATLDPAPITGDPALAESLIANLADNALRHNIPSGRIEISTGRTAAGAVLTVANTGRVIPPGRGSWPFRAVPPVRRGTSPLRRRIRTGSGDRPGDRRCPHRPTHRPLQPRRRPNRPGDIPHYRRPAPVTPQGFAPKAHRGVRGVAPINTAGRCRRPPKAAERGRPGGLGGLPPGKALRADPARASKTPSIGRRRVATGANHPASHSSALRRGPGTPAGAPTGDQSTGKHVTPNPPLVRQDRNPKRIWSRSPAARLISPFR